MLGASASSRSVTFSSLAASFSSDAASHCCRSPFSYQTALQRPCSSRAGYTVIPHSSSITGPPPRVAARPGPLSRTLPRAVRPAFARPAEDRAAPPRTGCGDLGPRGRFLRHGDSLSSCVVAGERADACS